MRDKKTLGTYGFIVFAILLSKLLGLVRDALMANFYGTGAEAAAFATASRIPLTIFDITLGTAVAAAFIPVLNEYLETSSKERGFKFVNNFLNASLILALVLAAAVAVFPEFFVSLLASGLTGESASLSAVLLMMFAAIVPLATMCYTFVGVLQSFGSFRIPAVMSLLANALMVTYFLTLNGRFGIIGLGAALLLGWVLQLGILLPPLIKSGYRFRLGLSLGDEGLKKSLKMAGPVLISSWVMPINNLITLNIASHFGNHGITVLDYSYKLYFIVAGVFSFAMTNLYFPSLSRLSAAGDGEGAQDMLYSMLKNVTIIIAPVMAFFIAFSPQIVSVVYQGGAFLQSDAQMTSIALSIYTIGMFGFSWQEILNKYFYSMKNSKTPMKVAIVSIAINLVLALILARTPLSIYGIALSSGISITYAGAALYIAQKRSLKSSGQGRRVWDFLLKMLFCFAVSTGVMLLMSRLINALSLGRLMTLLALIICFIIGGLVYITATKLFRIREVSDIMSLIFGKLKKPHKDGIIERQE